MKKGLFTSYRAVGYSIILWAYSTTLHTFDFSDIPAIVDRTQQAHIDTTTLVNTYIDAIKNGNDTFINEHIQQIPQPVLDQLKSRNNLLFLAINAYQETLFNPSLTERSRMSRYNQAYNTLIQELARQSNEIIMQRLMGELRTRITSSGTQVLWSLLSPPIDRLIRYEKIIDTLISWHLASANEINTTSGQTILMRAAELGWCGLATLLLRHNADRLITDANGRTALMIAIDNNHTDVAKILLSSKEELTATDTPQLPLIHTIISSPLTKKVQARLENVANTSVAKQLNSFGNTIWGTIAQWWNTTTMATQPSPTTDTIHDSYGIELRDKQGNSALMYATKHNNTAIQQLLLKKGAKIHNDNIATLPINH